MKLNIYTPNFLNQKIKKANNNKGLILIDMAIVLLLITVLTGETLSLFSIQHKIKKIKETDKILITIRDSLIGYSIINKRLPCADIDNDGMEDCDALVGTVPYKDLGVNGLDSWGKPINYEVSTNYIKTIPYPSSIVTPVYMYTNDNELKMSGFTFAYYQLKTE